LSKISHALDVPLSWLLEDQPEQDLVLLSRDKRSSKVSDEHMGYSYELLANRSPYTGVEPTIVHVTPKNRNRREEDYTHSHDEFIYMLNGGIKLYYDVKDHLMSEGDITYFTWKKPHLLIMIDDEGAEVLTWYIEQND